MKEIKASEKLKDALTEVFHIGVGLSAEVLSELLDQAIDMEVPDLHFLDHEAFGQFVHGLKGHYICIVQEIHGDLEGMGTLSFPLVEGKTLVDYLVGDSVSKPEISAMETEAIQEVGNIIINAVGSAFDDIVGLKINYDVPKVMFLEYPVPLDFSVQNESGFYTFAHARLKAQESDIEGYLNMMFAYANFDVLERIFRETGELTLKFGELLLEAHYITKEQLQEALQIQKNSGKFIGELMVEHGYISTEQRDAVLQSEQYRQYSKKFGEALLEESLITSEQLQKMLELQRRSKSLIGEILIALGYLDPDLCERTLRQQRFGVKNPQEVQSGTNPEA
ncbi:MAG: hypothetical protein HQM13_08215 [SAR324 cluster bacterium]|nr:hypothetical protein [SAR324 cluster bacterium]